MANATPTQKVKDVPVRVPFVGTPLGRSTGTTDQRYINVIFDTVINPITTAKRTFVIKRPGLANSTQPPAGVATGRGIYAWDGRIYSVFADKIYSGTTDLGVTLAGSTGKCWFDETPQTFGTGKRLLVSDGTKLYSINTSDTVTTVSTSSDAQFPTSNLGPVVYFDTYILFGKANGEIWNSDADSEEAYTSTSFLAAEMYGDDLECIVRQKDQIVAFGTQAIEFYFDNANASGSPLLRIDQNAIQLGLVTKNSIARSGDILFFVAKTPQNHYSVWAINSTNEVGRISTSPIEKLLAGETTNMSSCTAFSIRIQGHTLYVLNLAGADRTIVFDFDEKMWCEWSNTSTAKFPGISATELSGTLYIQDATNGRVYTFGAGTFQDSGSNFTVTLQTSAYDFDSSHRKTLGVLDVYGDNTTGDLNESHSDDDYSTFSTARAIDMAGIKKRLTRLGSFRKRAFKFTFAGNYALRLEGMELHMRKGIH